MSFRVMITNTKRLQDKLAKLEKKKQANLRVALFRGANLVRKDAQISIHQGPKTGIVYEKKARGDGRNQRGQFKKKGAKGGVLHQASAPGEAPATDTGRLAGSITVVTDFESRNPSAIVNAGNKTTVKYAKWLEFGTKKIKPRPFLNPAFLKNKAKIQALIKESLKS